MVAMCPDIVMRDDLHRTVAVAKPLRRVLRYAVNQADRTVRLPRAIEEAVRLTLRAQIREHWLASVQYALTQRSADLFQESRISGAIYQCGEEAVTPLEREVVECIRARAAFRQTSDDLLADAMRDIATRVEERSCEQLSSAVGSKDGAQIRTILRAVRPLCQPKELIDSTGSVSRLTRLPDKQIDLDEPITP
jgi:hypothetical protein